MIGKFAARGVLIGLFAILLGACQRQQTIRVEGETQGTTYHVTVVACAQPHSEAQLQQLIVARLAEIDRALSNYRDDSELSRFNNAPFDTWIDLGRDMYAVLKVSEQISRESDGAFDITVAPLVSLWGFGPKQRSELIPDDSAIAAARTQVDYRQLELDPARPRARKRHTLAIDVNGIAQGYSVDQLADVLTAQACTDFLVEVGGELRLVGHNAEARPWRIGIEKPVDGFAAAQQALSGTGVGVTTAGDYHDYFEKDDVRYSHTIDPRSGRPIAHKLASVTVVAANATLADGYDTVLEVLGPEAGLQFARDHHLAAYFIIRSGKDFITSYTPEMASYLK
jgi:thiamine biosynthesis lipoprotein